MEQPWWHGELDKGHGHLLSTVDLIAPSVENARQDV
jgi:hypothetical protein